MNSSETVLLLVELESFSTSSPTERTRREDRHSKFYEISDNLASRAGVVNCQPAFRLRQG
jgi:hypothetical protein